MKNLLNISNITSFAKQDKKTFNPLSYFDPNGSKLEVFWYSKTAEATDTQVIDAVGDETRPVQSGRCYNPDNVNDEIIVAGVGASEISEVSAIGVDGSIITLSKSYASLVHTIDISGVLIWNIKAWGQGVTPTDSQKRAVTIEESGGQSNLFAWYKADETDGTTAFDSSGNENHGTITNATLSTFHATDVGVTYSWQNEVGYSDGVNLLSYSEDLSIIPDWTGTASVVGKVMTFQSNNEGKAQNFSVVAGDVITFSGRLKLLSGTIPSNIAARINAYGSALSGPSPIYIGDILNSNAGEFVEFANTINVVSTGTLTLQIRCDATDGTVEIEYEKIQAQYGSVVLDYQKTKSSPTEGVLIPRNEAILTQDVLGNPLQYTGRVKYNLYMVGSNCVNLDGVDDYGQFNFDLTGLSITTYKGTATPTIDTINNRITLTSGTFYNLVLSNGTIFPLAEGKGTISYARGDETKTITWKNITESVFWDTQNEYHSNITDGFYLNQVVRLPYIPQGVKVEDYPWRWITGLFYTNFKNNFFVPSNDGTILKGEQSDYDAVTLIDVNNQSLTTDFTLEMMRKFVNLITLNCHSNQITTLDVSANVNLVSLNCYINQLSNLDLSANVNLVNLYCYTNQLTNLNVSANVNLVNLYCHVNQLTNLDVSANIDLVNLVCHVNQITNLDVSNNVNLVDLRCYNNQLTNLNVSANVDLTILHFADNQITTVDISTNVNLSVLYCYNNQITNLDISTNVNLVNLRCYNNKLDNLVNSQILIDLDGHGKSNGYFQSTIFGGGTLTAAGLTAKSNLQAKGWTIVGL